MFYNIDLKKTSIVGLLAAAMALVMSFMFVGSVSAADEEINWVIADEYDDFEFTDGNFKYVGTGEYVEIPHTIQNFEVDSYNEMFKDYPGSQLKGVKSTNKNVKNMYGMFSGASGLTELDLSNFDTSQVTDMRYMFSGASGLTELDLSNFDTSQVTNMRYMFSSAIGLTELDLSNFDTSRVTDMSYMFSGASSLTELDLSSFDTSQVTGVSNMFFGVTTTEGYARTQADAEKLNNSSNKPASLTFVPTIKSNILKGQVDVSVEALPGVIQLSIINQNFKDSEATIDVTKDNLTFKDLGSFTYKIEDSRGSEGEVDVKLSMTEFKRESGDSTLSNFTAKFNDKNLTGGELLLENFDPNESAIKEKELKLNEVSFSGTKNNFIKSGKYKSTITVELQNVETP